MERGLHKKVRLGDILIKDGFITDEQLHKALQLQKDSGKRLGELLIEMGYVSEENICGSLSKLLGLEIINLATVRISEDVLGLVNPSVLRKHVMIPFEYKSNNPNVIRVAMADPMDLMAMDDISIITNLQVEAILATRTDIMLAIDQYYGDSEALFAAEQFAKERENRKANEEEETVDEVINSSPIVQLVKVMIEQAARQRASDIHVEALENKVRVRYRIDGALYDKMSYDTALLPAIITRIKIISGMDISEKRKPQDSRLTMNIDRIEYDVRVSILPTVYGEKCVMRLAQKQALTRDKKELGFSEAEMKKFDSILQKPHGILLVTGPTGSGKSTTLYTALSELNQEDVNIITVEDPVEANIDGVNQVQVNTKADLTFANALRSILRQDPDIIMIGEIRDEETATIAVQASITGHLVVSTLHTNSTASTITRLMDMGIESYLIADSMIGVIAQRLVRRLCPHCKQSRPATPVECEMLRVPPDSGQVIYEPKGCPMCGDTGYHGRIGVYEIMEISPTLRRMITERQSADKIMAQAQTEGMVPLASGAENLVREGITSISEMIRIEHET